MIVQENKGVLLTNTTKQSGFTINATGHAFRILSDGLYQHKVAAILRELTCNAYDSHVQAGKVDVPFVVTLPNWINSRFSVEDFGLGLDDDEIRNIFTSYFNSTKTNSNDAVGCFGLGSKTPFTMSDTFSIRSRKNGVERLYTAFIGDDGSPSITLFKEQPTLEGNGVKIDVPISTEWIYDFVGEAQFILSMFPVRPIVHSQQEFKWMYDGLLETLNEQEYAIVPLETTSSTLYGSNLFAMMGGVCYPFYLSNLDVPHDTQEWKYFLSVIQYNHFLKKSFFVKFDIGDLEVAASRESLSMTTKTIDVLSQKVWKIANEFKQKQQEKVDDCENKYQAVAYILNHINKNALVTNVFAYKGENLSNLRTRPLAGTVYWKHNRYKSPASTTRQSLDAFFEKPPTTVVFAFGRKNQRGIKTFCREVIKQDTKEIVHMLSGVSRASVERFYKMLGLSPNIVEYVPQKPVKRVYTGVKRKLDTSTIKAVTTTFTKDAFYTNHQFTIDLKDGKKYAYYASFKSGYQLFDEDKSIYVLSGMYALLNDYTFVKMSKVNEKKIKANNIPSAVDIVNKVIIAKKDEILEQVFLGEVYRHQEVLKKIKNVDSDYKDVDTDKVYDYDVCRLSVFLDQKEVEKEREKAREWIRKVKEKYFFIEHISNHSNIIDRLIELVNR